MNNSRNIDTGRYSNTIGLNELCVCGHTNSIHAGEPPHPCFNEDRGIKGATGTQCACNKFTLPTTKMKHDTTMEERAPEEWANEVIKLLECLNLKTAMFYNRPRGKILYPEFHEIRKAINTLCDERIKQAVRDAKKEMAREIKGLMNVSRTEWEAMDNLLEALLAPETLPTNEE